MQSTLEKRRDNQAKLYCASLSAEVACTQLDSWPKAQVECGTMKTVINAAHPMASAVPRAPRASTLAIRVAGSGLAPFWHFGFGPLRGTCAQGPNQGVSTLEAVTGEYGAGQMRSRGPQLDPSDGPMAGLVEGDT